MRIFSFEVGLFILLFTECTIAENAEAAAERSYEELRGACNMEELLPLMSFPVPWRKCFGSFLKGNKATAKQRG